MTWTKCDACCAQAYVTVTSPGGNRLDFCAHHYAEYADSLVAWTIVDRRAALSL